MATKKKELSPEVEQQLGDIFKKKLEAAYIRGMKAGCKTIASYCLECHKKYKAGVALYKILQMCKKTMDLPKDKPESGSGKVSEETDHDTKIEQLNSEIEAIKAEPFVLDEFLKQQEEGKDN